MYTASSSEVTLSTVSRRSVPASSMRYLAPAHSRVSSLYHAVSMGGCGTSHWNVADAFSGTSRSCSRFLKGTLGSAEKELSCPGALGELPDLDMSLHTDPEPPSSCTLVQPQPEASDSTRQWNRTARAAKTSIHGFLYQTGTGWGEGSSSQRWKEKTGGLGRSLCLCSLRTVTSCPAPGAHLARRLARSCRSGPRGWTPCKYRGHSLTACRRGS
ncbi:putative uncharacterized protein OBSCN-AS1 [Sagmatias obliquidens]|uniref:putative uncharacterized protein OBSCN-AS1 n=1 Tax=Sagmatias obliquidens TaxID=3371155 RepID=UPI000F442946|nr:putative uncharacterized protein OBSCN-AS1 [Lagenorhynchus obliquidens]